MSSELESQIEELLVKLVKKRGGYCYKWVSPSNRGVPDRIVFLNKQIWFVELKTPRGRLSKLQEVVGKIIQRFTDNYVVLKSRMEVADFVENVCQLRALNLESKVQLLEEELEEAQEKVSYLEQLVEAKDDEIFSLKNRLATINARIKARSLL
jgi:hypothetical protein